VELSRVSTSPKFRTVVVRMRCIHCVKWNAVIYVVM
jgi:hypothetical protein